MKSVVITGASTGIGWAAAKLLLERGFRVFGSVRKQADADRLKSEFGVNFTPLIFDVTDEPAVLAAAREVRAALGGEKLAGLVNNAGHLGRGPCARAVGGQVPPADGGQRDRAGHRHPGLWSAARRRPLAQRPARPDRDDLVGRRQERQPVHVGLCRLEACDRGVFRKPAPRIDAVRHRRHHRRARAGEDADLEQGEGGRRHLPLPELALFAGPAEGHRLSYSNSSRSACRPRRSPSASTTR